LIEKKHFYLAFYLIYYEWKFFQTEDKMKKLLSIFALVLLIGFTAQAKPANPPAAFGIFFSTLNPHGQWVELDYGLVVWRPTIIKRGWAPYRIGHWVWTIDGWYWDSYEPFGHVTYHYGRWYHDNYYGWIWIPDYEWAPAWVEWRYDDVYIGWAPLPPYARFSINIGIHYTHSYYTPYHHWHFVTFRYFNQPYVYKHFVGHQYKNRIYTRTKYRTNYGYHDGRVVNRGVDVGLVRERSGREIRTRDIERVRDNATFERGRTTGERGGSNERVRTFYIPKDELQRERDLDREILRKEVKRADRKSTLDISKVEVGERLKREETDRDRSGAAGRNEVTDPKRNDRSPVETKKDDRRIEKSPGEKSDRKPAETRSDDRRTAPPVQDRRTEEIKKDNNRNETRSNIREMREVPVNTPNRSSGTVEKDRKGTTETRRSTENIIEKRPVEQSRTNPSVDNRRPVEQTRTVEPRKQEERKRTETNVQREDRPAERREVQKTETKKTEKDNSANDRNKQERSRTR
jgi:hypothetical protein